MSAKTQMIRREFLVLAGGSVIAPALVAGANPARVASKARRLATGCPIADPFCIRRADGWYLTGTQHAAGIEDRRFSLFHSPDLEHWTDLGPVLVRPDYEGSNRANYWAPEFTEIAGKYYFYYTSDSFGDPERRFVRVARSDHIRGPYVDSGAKLVDQPSIDGDPYFETPESGYLFYCGNEGKPHMGQLLVDRFVSPLKLENRPKRVFPNENVEWEEGPFVIRRNGFYYLFSSMGNWRDGSYHVRVAHAEKITGPWKRFERNGAPYKLLQTVEGQWGPGHNSVFRGPDDKWWICYHAWDKGRSGRYPWVARIEWDDSGFPSVSQ